MMKFFDKKPAVNQQQNLRAEMDNSLVDLQSTGSVSVVQPTPKQLKTKIIISGVLPITIILLLLSSLAVWRISANRQQESANNRDVSVTELDSSRVPIIETQTNAAEKRQVVFDQQVIANGSIILSPTVRPSEALAGQVYFDEASGELQVYDGDAYLQIVSLQANQQICFIGSDCGFATPDDIPVFTLPQDLSTSARPTFAGLNLTTSLAVLNGGTGATSFANNSVLLGSGSAALRNTNAATAGQILLATASGTPQFISLSGDVTIAPNGTTSLNTGSVGSDEIQSSGVSAGTFGSVTDYPVFTVDADGRITSASTLPVPGGGGGVGSLNTLVGAVTLQGTANQISATSGGSIITLATPQDIAVSSSPTFNGLTVSSITRGSDTITDFTGTGLQVVGGNLQTTIGSTVDGSEIVDGTIANADLVNSSITVSAGSGLSGGGAVSLGGTVVLSLANDFGASIDTTEITNGTILFADLNQNGCSNDEVIKWNGAAWVCGTDDTGAGTNTFSTIDVPSGTDPVADSTSDTLSLLSGAGISIVGDGVLDTITISATLGGSVDLASEVTGQLPIANGGTGAATAQAAINALSGLSSNGDLLFFDGANSTRLARGSNGQCLLSNSTTLLWGSCAGTGTTFFTLSGTSGTPQSINGGDTVTIAAGSSGNITTTAGATDNVTVDIISNPTFSGLVTLQAGVTISAGQTLTIGGDAINDFTGTGLTLVGNQLQTSLGVSVDGSEIVDASIEEVDLEISNAPTDNYVLTYDQASGGFTWVDPTSVGVGYSFSVSDGTTTEVVNDGNTLTVVDGSNINAVVSATDTLTLSVISNPTFSGLVTANGGLTVEAGDTFTFNGDAFNDLVGVGLTISGGSLQTTLGTSIQNGEVDDDLTISAFGSVADGALSANVSLLGSAIDLGSEVSGQLPVANGGTGANNATDARTNLGAAASGANGDITSLTALTAITPTAALTVGATGQSFTLQGTDASTITATDSGFTTTLAFAAPTANVILSLPALAAGSYDICTTSGNCLGGGGGGANTALSNLSAVAINTSLLPGAATIDLGSAAAPFRDAYLLGFLLFEGSVIDGFETVINVENPTADITYTFADAPNGAYEICTTIGNCIGGGSGSAPSDAEYLVLSTNGSLSAERVLTAGTNISITDGGANGAATVSIINNPAFSGLVTLNGGLTIETGDTFTFNGDAFTDLTGTGLTISGGVLQATLGTTIDSSEIVNGTILFEDISQNGCSNDEVIKWNGSAWICGADATGSGTNAFATIATPAGTSPVADSNTDTLTLADGAGITITGDGTTDTITIAAVLGSSVDLASEVTGTLPVNNGGTGSGSFTTNGVLFGNGTSALDATAAGTTGQCLLATTGFAPSWGSCAGTGTTFFTLSGTSGTPQSINGGDTVTIAAGSSGNITTTAGATDNVTVDIISNPTFSGLVTLQAGVTISAGQTLTIGGDSIDELVGVGLQLSGGDLQVILGDTIEGSEIMNATIEEIDLDITNAPTDDYVLTFDQASGGFTWVDPAAVGVSYSFSVDDGTTQQTINNTNVLTFTDGANIDAVVSATDTITISVVNNPTFSGLMTLNGGLLVEAGDTFTFNGDAITDLTGTGLTVSSGALQTTLGIAIDTAEITNATILFEDFAQNGCSNDDVIKWNGSAWICGADATGSGTNTFATIGTPAGTSPVADSTSDVLTLLNGAGISIAGDSSTDEITIAAILGANIEGNEIVDGTIEEIDLEITNAATDNYVLTFDSASGGFTWVDPTTVGVAYDFDISDGVTTENISSGDLITFTGGSNVNAVVSATDTLTISIINNPTFSGLLTLNGGLSVEAGDTFTFNGDAITDLTGTGLTLNGSSLETTLGTTIDSTEITNGTILFADLNQNGCSNDEVIKWNGSAWICGIDSTGSGTNTFATIATPSGTSPVADSTTDTLTLSQGAGITIVGDGTTDTVTITAVLGATIDGSEIEDNTIEEVDLEVTNAPTDNYVLTYDSATGGFTWVDPSGLGTSSAFDITDGTTTQNIANGNTLTFVDGSNIDVVVSATDTVTVNLISNPTISGLTTLNGGLTLVGVTNINTTGTAATSIGNSGAVTTLTGSSILLNSATLSRTAAGTTSLDLVNGANTTLALLNSGAGVANLTVDGSITGASTLSLGTASTTNGTLTLLNSTNAFGVTISAANQTVGSATISIPNTAGVADTFCLSTLNNCAAGATGFINGGNSFGTTATLGTNDSNNLIFETNNQSAATIAVGGATTFRNASDTINAFRVQNASGSNTVLNVDTVNNRVGVGTASPTATLDVSQASITTTALRVGYGSTPSSPSTAFSEINFEALSIAAPSWTSFTATSASALTEVTVDTVAGVLYVGDSGGNRVYRCALSTNCDATGDWTSYSITGAAAGIWAMYYEPVSGFLYASSQSASNNGTVHRCNPVATNCDATGDWSAAVLSSIDRTYDFITDTTNNVLYMTNYSGLYRCVLSTNCDAPGDWSLVSTVPLRGLYFEPTSGVLYVTTRDNRKVLRCDTTTGCDILAELVDTYTNPSGTLIEIIYDDTDKLLAVSGTGEVISCLLSTGCDASGDWSVMVTGLGTSANSITVDTINDVLYVATTTSGIVYSCAQVTGCNSISEWLLNYDATLTAPADIFYSSVESEIYMVGNSSSIFRYAVSGSGANRQFTSIKNYAINTSNATETGAIGFSTLVNGTSIQGFYLQGGSATLGTASVAGSLSVANGTGGNWFNVSNTGNTTISSATAGSILLGSSGVANTIQIGNTTGAVAQTINIGNNATASSSTTVTLGSTIGASANTIQSGTAGTSVTSTTSTGTGVSIINNSLTTGNGLSVSSSSANITSGNLATITQSGTFTSGLEVVSGSTFNVNRNLTNNATSATVQIEATTISSGVSSASSHTFSHTVGVRANQILIVEVANSGSATPTGVTFNGLAMTMYTSASSPGSVNTGSVWYLVNPPVTTANVVISLSTSQTIRGLATNLSNVNTASPLSGAQTASVTGTSSSLNVTSTLGSKVLDMIIGNSVSPIYSAGSNQSVRYNEGLASTHTFGTVEDGTNGTITMSDTISSSIGFAHIAYNVAPSPLPGVAVVGSAASIQSNCTVTSGGCYDSSSVLNVSQNYLQSSGTVFRVTGAGTGSLLEAIDGTTTVLRVADGGSTTLTANGGTNVALTVNNGTSTGNIFVLQDNTTPVFTAADGGAATFQNATNSTAAFRVLNAAGTSTILNVDTTNNEVEVGSASSVGRLVISDGSSNTGTILVQATSGDYTFTIPTVTSNDTFCLVSLGNCSGLGGLQASYNAGNTITTTDARDILFTLADTATDSNLLVNIATGSTGRFAVQNNGTDVLGVASNGVLTLSSGETINNSTNGQIAINNATPTASATVASLLIGANNISGGSVNGTYLGVNSASSFVGDFINLQQGNTSLFRFTAASASNNNGIVFSSAAAGQASSINPTQVAGLGVYGGGTGGNLTLSNLGGGTVNVGSQFGGQYQDIYVGETGGGSTFLRGGSGITIQGSSTGVVFSGMTTDITTGTNEDLTVVANGSGIIVLDDTVSVLGAATFQNTTDSTAGFRVMDADGGTPILQVNTTDEQIGIGTATPDAKLAIRHSSATETALSLQVRGDQDSSTDLFVALDAGGQKRSWINEKGELRTRAAEDNSVALRVKQNSGTQTGHLLQLTDASNAILTFFDGEGRLGVGYAPVSNTADAAATVAIDAVTNSDIALLVRGNSTSQSGNLIEAVDNTTNNNTVFSLGSSGVVNFQNSSNSDSAFIIRRQNGTAIFVVDTLNSRVGTGTTTGASVNSQQFLLRTGDAIGTGSNTGDVLVRSGSSTSGSSGNVSLEVGGFGTTPGTINIGSSNRSNSINIGISGSTVIQSTVNIATTTGNANQTVNIGSSTNSSSSVTILAGSTGGISLGANTSVTGNLTVSGNFLPNAASSRDLGSATLEFDELFVGDNNGIRLGLDQDALLAYDETTDDRVELTGSGASLFIEDRVGFGRQTFTMTTVGAATENVTPAASYIEITGQDNATDIVQIQTTNAREGDLLIITNISATTVNIDQNATTKLAGGIDSALTQFDVMILIFDGTNWLQVSAVTNNS